MIINFEQLKLLVEAGDKSAIEQHILKALENGDVTAAAAVNSLVKSELDSAKEAHHTAALGTWKLNNLQGLIDDAVKASNPAETPEQKRIRELEEKIANSEKETKRNELKAKAFEHATKQGLSPEFATKYVERFLGEDEAITQNVLNEFKTDLDALVQTQVKETLKSNSTRGVGGGVPGAADKESSYGAKLAQSANATDVAAAQEHYFK